MHKRKREYNLSDEQIQLVRKALIHWRHTSPDLSWDERARLADEIIDELFPLDKEQP